MMEKRVEIPFEVFAVSLAYPAWARCRAPAAAAAVERVPVAAAAAGDASGGWPAALSRRAFRGRR